MTGFYQKKDVAGRHSGRKKSLFLLTLIVSVLVSVFSFFGVSGVRATDVSGNISSNTTWDSAGSPYNLTGNVTVISGATLTVDAGVEVKSNGNYTLTISDGTLDVNGASGTEVTFTHNTSTSRGAWHGIYIQDNGSATISYAEITYADMGVRVNGGSLDIDNSTLDTCNAGISVYDDGDLTTDSNDFNGNIVPLNINPDAGTISLGSGGSVDAMGSGADENDFDTISIGFNDPTVGNCTTLSAGKCQIVQRNFAGETNIPRIVYTTIVVSGSNYELEIQNDVILKFNAWNIGINIYSGAFLDVNGTSGNEVIFTSYRDDANGGDTNNDGVSSGVRGDFGNYGVFNLDSGSNDIEYAEFIYGRTAMLVSGSSTTLEVTDSEFDTNRIGISVYEGAGLTTKSNTFTNNEYYPIDIDPDVGTILLGSGADVDTIGTIGGSDANGFDAIGIGYSDGTANNCSGLSAGKCQIVKRNFAGVTNIPYMIHSTYRLNTSGYELEIDEDIVIKFQAWNVGINIYNGAFVDVNGTSGNEVIFTSYRDDTHGGDTNNDGVSSGSRSDYGHSGALNLTGGSNDIEYAEFIYGRTAMQVSGSSTTLEVTDSMFDTNRIGISVYEGAGLTTKSNTFTNNEYYPIDIDPDVGTILLGSGADVDTIGTIGGSDANGFDAIGIGYSSGTANNCSGLSAGKCQIVERNFAGITNIPYVVYGKYYLSTSGYELEIDEDIVIKFRVSDGGLIMRNGAFLDVNGTSGNEVIFTSYRDDTHGGDTNNDGGATSPAVADYDYQTIDGGTSEIDYAKFYYSDIGVRVLDSSGSLTVRDSLFDHNHVGISAYEGADLTTLRNTFTNNDNYPISLSTDIETISLGSGADVDTMSGNGYDAIGIGYSDGTARNCTSLSNGKCRIIKRDFAGETNIPYVVHSRYYVNTSGYELEIDSGIIIKFYHWDHEFVIENGAFIDINGTSDDWVYFTSSLDDDVGGDTNNDSNATTPSAADWRNLHLQDGGAHEIDFLKLLYSDRGLYVNGATSVNVEDSTFQNGNYGVQCNTSTSPSFARVNIEDNATYGMYNDSTSTVINAENLWWDAADGPYDDSNDGQCTQNLGSGDNVSDDSDRDIDYCPYAVTQFNSDTCAQNSDCSGGEYCSTDGSCENQKTTNGTCDYSVTELDSANESNGVCTSGYCRDDYDDSGDGDGGCETGESCWCVDSSTDCSTDATSIDTGTYASGDCLSGGSGGSEGERAQCSSGSWQGVGCGYGGTWTCSGSCRRVRDVNYCQDSDNTCYNGGQNNYESCPAGEACSGDICSSATLCNSNWQYGPGSGDDNYGAGGQYSCQGSCDGTNSCDYAVNCDFDGLVTDLNALLSAVTTDTEEDVTTEPQDGVKEIRLSRPGNNHRITEFNVDFSANRDWTSMTANTSDNESFFHYPGGFSSIPGATGSGYTLYVPIPTGSNSNKVIICPGAENLGQVSEGCSGAVEKEESDSDTSKVDVNGDLYWKIENLTGTGGISLVDSFELRDTLTRLEVSQSSDHTINFGTVNGLTATGDTIEIEFDPSGQSWNLGSIGIGDIDLEDDGTDKTLAAAAGADIWGVSINAVTDTITFTAPTSGTDYMVANSIIVVKIGTVADSGSNQIVNPSSVGEYEIHIKLDNNSGVETGEVEIPIIDDDTVNVRSYTDTMLTFDIDIAVTDTDCDASGGASPCDSHGGASDDLGYVVDLGEMTLSSVNRSGDSVLHSDGLSGAINYIWFDLESNADGGVVVTIVSLNERMEMDGSNYIPDVAGGSEQQITFADGLYGINHRSGFVSSSTSGTVVVHDDCDCDSGDDYYCDMSDGGVPVEIFNSSSNPLDDGRVQWAVGVAPDSDDGTGTYMDQLTFIATATF